MNWDQISFLFNIERTSEGYPKFVPASGPSTSPRKLFDKHCFLNGITDEETVETLWRMKLEAKKQAEQANNERR